MKSLLAMVAVSALLLGACNSDDSTGDGPSSSAGAGSPSGAGAGGGGSGVDGASGGAGGGQGDGESPGDGGAGAAGEGGSAASAGEGGSDVGPVDTTLRTYAADDKNIQLTGRVDWSDPKKPRFSAPGVQIQARFKGVSVAVTLRDEHKWDKYFNYFDVIVDDGEAKKIQVLPEVKDYEIASNLPNGEHTVTVVKRTEAAVGYTEFLGFKIAGEIMAPPARPTRRIEFVGDSISCGSGIEAPNGSEQCNEDEWGQPYHNARLAFGPVVARELGAEAVVTAVSGIGLVRNYSFMYDARPMPEVYGLTFLELEDSPAWDRARFVPDAVVIALGTNDFSPGDSEREKMDPATYADAYIDFVGQLRSYYPDAHVFCLSSPMLGDGWPEATDMSATDLKTALTNVEEHFAGLGDAKVHKLFVPKMSGKGCGTHPDASEHAEIAKVVAPFIKSTMGW